MSDSLQSFSCANHSSRRKLMGCQVHELRLKVLALLDPQTSLEGQVPRTKTRVHADLAGGQSPLLCSGIPVTQVTPCKWKVQRARRARAEAEFLEAS